MAAYACNAETQGLTRDIKASKLSWARPLAEWSMQVSEMVNHACQARQLQQGVSMQRHNMGKAKQSSTNGRQELLGTGQGGAQVAAPARAA